MWGLAKTANKYYGIKGDDLTDLTDDAGFVDMYEKDNSLGDDLRNAELEGVKRGQDDKRFANNIGFATAIGGGVLAPVAAGLATLKSRRIGNLVDTAPEMIGTGAAVAGMLGGAALGKKYGDGRTDKRREDYLENTLKPKAFAYQDNELAMLDYKEENDYDGFLRGSKPIDKEMFGRIKAEADRKSSFVTTRTAQEGHNEMYGLAKLATEDKASNVDNLAAGAVVGLGAKYTKDKYPGVRDKLTGMETLHHGTDNLWVDSIKEKGLLGSKGLEPGRRQSRMATEALGLNPDEMANKVYLTRDKKYAELNAGFHHSRKDGVINAKVPFRDLNNGTLKEVANPELHGATNVKDFAKKRIKMTKDSLDFNPHLAGMSRSEIGEAMRTPQYKLHMKKLFENVSAPKGITLEGDLPSRYIEGAKDFRGGQTLKGFGDYIQHHPGRFAKGMGAATVGPGVVLGGAAYLNNERKELKERQKEASEAMYGLAKLASYYYGIKGDGLTDLTGDKEFVEMYDKGDSLRGSLKESRQEFVKEHSKKDATARKIGFASALGGGALGTAAALGAGIKSKRIGNIVDKSPEAAMLLSGAVGMVAGGAIGSKVGDNQKNKHLDGYIKNTLHPQLVDYKKHQQGMSAYKEKNGYVGFARGSKPVDEKKFGQVKSQIDQHNTNR